MRLIDLAVPAALAAMAPMAVATTSSGLTPDKLALVYQRMVELSTKSWENGTRAQATLEWKNASLSVFSPTTPLPLPDGLQSSSIPEIIELAESTLANRPNASDYKVNATSTTTTAALEDTATATDGSSDGEQTASATTTANATATSTPWVNVPAMNNTQLPVGWPLLKDDAAGDPASLGVAVLLANATTGDATYNGETYGAAAEAQLNFLLYDVPRTAQGAISHRVNEAQLWADNVYMVPPFLAYYGALTNNQTLLDLAYTQISLYRDALRHSDTNLWQHTVYGGVVDSGMWATGNAWVVAGCARVIATIQRSSFASSMSSQVADLQSWASEILGATEKYISSNGLLHNYVDNSSSFEDSTSSALMAAGGLRLSTLNLTNDYVNMSLTLLSGVSKKVNDTGYVTQVTDPYTFSKQGTESPEAQSFVILAYSAYNEWVAQGSNGIEKGKNPIGSSAASPRATAGMAGLLALATALWVLA
ncbi:uncharacterized protein EHS24_004717 [Apiotrichum porosum]|uniref:Six-hairpin glycosidase n=1 Tax=Apiotrichum porosum TaxID=105984 RepID=A0A427Y5U7_9TREE|nr:uncharacterized protein EHS24_004717 [Apiotrichum porosum]RSH86461.1 hypothetical protein EHS24_004717 [Apiotrichum porosum]